jgi:PEGA domain
MSQLATDSLVVGRPQLESALRSSGDSLLVTVSSERERLELLESIWVRPPKGFAPIPVPCRDIGARGIAARILAITRDSVGDPEGALARMMRTQSIRGARPLLLLDDLEAIPLAELSRLREIADGCRVEVRWVAGVSGSGASAAALGLLPPPVRVVALDAADSLRKTEADISPPTAAVSFEERASSEPAAPPRVPEIPRPPPPPRAPPPLRSPPPRLPPPTRTPLLPRMRPVAPAPSHAVPRRDSPPREATYKPIRTHAMETERSMLSRLDVSSTPPRARPPLRGRPSLPSRKTFRTVAVALIGFAALVLLVDRAPPLLARATGATAASVRAATAFAANEWNSIRDAAGSLLSDARNGGRRIAESTEALAARAVETARELAASEPTEEPPPDVGAAPPEPIEPPQPAKPVRPIDTVERPTPAAPAGPPIRVGVNSDPWSNVAVDGVDFGSTPLSIPLPPGLHRFHVRMSDGRIIEKEIEIAKGRDEVVFR